MKNVMNKFKDMRYGLVSMNTLFIRILLLVLSSLFISSQLLSVQSDLDKEQQTAITTSFHNGDSEEDPKNLDFVHSSFEVTEVEEELKKGKEKYDDPVVVSNGIGFHIYLVYAHPCLNIKRQINYLEKNILILYCSLLI